MKTKRLEVADANGAKVASPTNELAAHIAAVTEVERELVTMITRVSSSLIFLVNGADPSPALHGGLIEAEKDPRHAMSFVCTGIGEMK